MMDRLIGLEQSNIIRGKKLIDGVMALNEVIDQARISKKYYLIFKVDFD